jgi:hypothetical protein
MQVQYEHRAKYGERSDELPRRISSIPERGFPLSIVSTPLIAGRDWMRTDRNNVSGRARVRLAGFVSILSISFFRNCGFSARVILKRGIAKNGL